MDIIVDEEFIQKFNKAYSALDKPTRFTVESKFDEIQLAEFVVGESISYANKIKFQHESSFFLGSKSLPFSAPVFKEILTANKDVKFYEFQDWTDLQRGILQILDKYYESKYQTEKCYG